MDKNDIKRSWKNCKSDLQTCGKFYKMLLMIIAVCLIVFHIVMFFLLLNAYQINFYSFCGMKNNQNFWFAVYHYIFTLLFYMPYYIMTIIWGLFSIVCFIPISNIVSSFVVIVFVPWFSSKGLEIREEVQGRMRNKQLPYLIALFIITFVVIVYDLDMLPYWGANRSTTDNMIVLLKNGMKYLFVLAFIVSIGYNISAYLLIRRMGGNISNGLSKVGSYFFSEAAVRSNLIRLIHGSVLIGMLLFIIFPLLGYSITFLESKIIKFLCNVREYIGMLDLDSIHFEEEWFSCSYLTESYSSRVPFKGLLGNQVALEAIDSMQNMILWLFLFFLLLEILFPYLLGLYLGSSGWKMKLIKAVFVSAFKSSVMVAFIGMMLSKATVDPEGHFLLSILAFMGSFFLGIDGKEVISNPDFKRH